MKPCPHAASRRLGLPRYSRTTTSCATLTAATRLRLFRERTGPAIGSPALASMRFCARNSCLMPNLLQFDFGQHLADFIFARDGSYSFKETSEAFTRRLPKMPAD